MNFNILCQNSTALTEKYRPRFLSEFRGQEQATNIIGNFLKKKRIIPFLFFGKSGTGKTTMAYVIANELNATILEVNSSHEKNQDTLKKIENFNIVIPPHYITGEKSRFKVLLLEELDGAPNSFQESLRRIMEHSISTIFIVTCNNLNKIDDAVKSRCFCLEFKPLSRDVIINQLSHIANQEGLTVDPSVIEAIAKDSNGDLRKAINMLDAYT
jgi:DNA polymerase III delta prime subunit